MLVLTVLAIVQLLVNNAACQEQTCKITKTYSCDEYRHSSNHYAVGKMGPRGPPGKDCNMTMVKEHLRKVQHKLNKTKLELTELKEQRSFRQPRDCYDVKKLDPLSPSGVYKIYPVFSDIEGFLVYCDQETEGGGWTLFQRRFSGEQDFQKNWVSYANGFGNPNNEYWLGLERLYQMTHTGLFKLRVDLEDFEDNRVYAEYKSFSIGKREGYTLNLDASSYEGTAGDSLSHHNGHSFSTPDKDQDSHKSANCAEIYSPWWHVACHASNLNGLYLEGETTKHATGMVWKSFKGYYYSLKTSEMKFKPVYDY